MREPQKAERYIPSALPRLVALLGLVDDVDAALAANQLVVAMTLAEALQAVADLHDRILSKFHAVAREFIHPNADLVVTDTRSSRNHHHMVGATGIEPVTPTMSR